LAILIIIEESVRNSSSSSPNDARQSLDAQTMPILLSIHAEGLALHIEVLNEVMMMVGYRINSLLQVMHLSAAVWCMQWSCLEASICHFGDALVP
jgi:hypothetical protein